MSSCNIAIIAKRNFQYHSTLYMRETLLYDRFINMLIVAKSSHNVNGLPMFHAEHSNCLSFQCPLLTKRTCD